MIMNDATYSGPHGWKEVSRLASSGTSNLDPECTGSTTAKQANLKICPRSSLTCRGNSGEFPSSSTVVSSSAALGGRRLSEAPACGGASLRRPGGPLRACALWRLRPGTQVVGREVAVGPNPGNAGNPGAPFVASLLLVVMPGARSVAVEALPELLPQERCP